MVLGANLDSENGVRMEVGLGRCGEAVGVREDEASVGLCEGEGRGIEPSDAVRFGLAHFPLTLLSEMLLSALIV